jgi:hypothetical protein
MQALTGSNTTLAALAPLRFPPEERIRRKGEADLIRRAQSGDRQALETLIEYNRQDVVNMVRSWASPAARCRRPAASRHRLIFTTEARRDSAHAYYLPGTSS